MSDAPPMPDWAPPDGPWCLKQWLPFNDADVKIDACLLSPDHDGDCRGVYGRWHNPDVSLIIGQLKLKRDVDPLAYRLGGPGGRVDVTGA